MLEISIMENAQLHNRHATKEHDGKNTSDQTHQESDDAAQTEAPKSRILYGLEDVPPWYATIMFGMQQLLSSFGPIVSSTIIIGIRMCMGHDPLIMTRLLCSGFLICGIGTLLQSTFGCRLAIIQGNGAFFVSVLAILSYKGPCPVMSPSGNSTQEEFDILEDAWRNRMLELQGGILVASCIQVLLGFSGLIGFLLRFIGPLTITPTVSLVGLAIVPPAVEMSGDHWGIAGLTIGLIIVMSQYLAPFNIPIPAYNSEKKLYISRSPIFQLFPIIIAILVAWVLCVILTAAGVFPDDPSDPAYNARTDIKLDVLDSSPWFWFPYPGQWGRPILTVGAVLGITAGVMCSVIESVGDYYACARISEAPNPPTHAINRGIAMEGIACVCAGAWGNGLGVTSYSECIGNIGITQVGSRIVAQVVGGGLILLGLFAKVGALVATIPYPIIGGALFVGGCMILAIGLSSLQFVDLNRTRNLFVLGVAMCCGHGLPLWMSGHPGAINTGAPDVDAIFTILMSNAIFIGGLTGCILDNTIPGTLEERGMLKWRKAPDETDPKLGDMKSYDLPFGMSYIRRSNLWKYLPFSPTFQGFPWEKEPGLPNTGVTDVYCALDESQPARYDDNENDQTRETDKDTPM